MHHVLAPFRPCPLDLRAEDVSDMIHDVLENLFYRATVADGIWTTNSRFMRSVRIDVWSLFHVVPFSGCTSSSPFDRATQQKSECGCREESLGGISPENVNEGAAHICEIVLSEIGCSPFHAIGETMCRVYSSRSAGHACSRLVYRRRRSFQSGSGVFALLISGLRRRIRPLT